ncbi:MAG TPA: protein-disulfide reductase DsbD N-terminal domain-containing protein [Terriglobales bacterium]|nr:protein-disulfide reductase DsbD N-terminal domain-containing protein [Terriglobales bacterium]
MKMRFATAVLLTIAISASAQLSERFNKASYVTMQESPAVVVAKGKPVSATIRFRVNKGFHVNSNKPSSDLLIPTEIKFEPQAGILIGKIAYPAGEEFELSFSPKQKLSVYQGNVAVTVPLSAAKRTKPGIYALRGSLSYQACNDNACFPPKTAPFELNIQVK